VPHDAAQPTWKCCRVGKAGQSRPGCYKGFLNHVLGSLKVANQRQRRAVGRVLEAPRKFYKGLHVAAAGSVDQWFEFHRCTLTRRCQEKGIAFKVSKII